MNKAKQILLKALSSPDSRLDVEKSRKLMNLKALDPLKPFYRTLDTKFYREGREIPLRIYFPDSESYQTAEAVQKGDMTDNIYPVLLYIHGGGFVTESVDSYSRVCRNLAKHTRHVVVAIDYPLAPEHRFPTQVEDCYAVAKAVFADRNLLNADPDSITIMGDSAGGKSDCGCDLMARDRRGVCAAQTDTDLPLCQQQLPGEQRLCFPYGERAGLPVDTAEYGGLSGLLPVFREGQRKPLFCSASGRGFHQSAENSDYYRGI
mgnify:CR=1 FL=1